MSDEEYDIIDPEEVIQDMDGSDRDSSSDEELDQESLILSNIENINIFRKNYESLKKNYKTSKYRLTYGLSYKWDQIGKFKVFYRRENNILETLPKNVAIVGLNYVYSIN